MIEEYCVSDLGRERVRALRPISRALEMKSELNQVNEYLASFENENRIPNHYFEEITRELHLLGIEDSFLEAEAFNKLASISENVNILLGFLEKFKEYYPVLYEESLDLDRTQDIQKNIQRVISPHGEVLDKASETLLSIRKQIGSIRGKLGSSFNKSLAHYASQGYLDEIRESVVDNQRVLAVQAMYRKKVRGAIMGNSKTGSIVYIAPESTLQLTRELQNMKYEEKEEVVKILKALTDTIRPYRELLAKYQDYLVTWTPSELEPNTRKKLGPVCQT